MENIAYVDDAVAEDNDEEDADFDGVSDTEIVLNDNDTVQDQVAKNDIETNRNTVKSKNSDIDKELAQTELKSVVKKRRKDKTASGMGDNADTCISEVNEEELSVKNQQRNSHFVALETMKTVKHMPENVVAEDHDTEVCLDVPDDVDESGYSASLAVYICKDCGYAFPENNYMLHKRDGLCVFPCQFCDTKYTFRNFTKYQTHLKTHR